MKRFGLFFALVFMLSTAFLSNGSTVSMGAPQESHGKKHGFGVMQYDAFHDVLHPLEHDALPAKDFKRIRAKSALLIKRGNAILRLGVPRGVTEANKDEFGNELGKFREAIARFKTAARTGSDSELVSSFDAVHDSFEMLAALLPRG